MFDANCGGGMIKITIKLKVEGSLRFLFFFCNSVQIVFVVIDVKRIVDGYLNNCSNVVGFNEKDIGAVVVNIMVDL
jgi:hypothetical protein